MNHDMRKILDLVGHFQTEAQKVERYTKNPFVKGDNVAEHLARAARLLVYITPDLKKEFPDQPRLVEEIFQCLLVHDDDEIIVGFDVVAPEKAHNQKDGEEIVQFTEAVSELPMDTREFLIGAFSSFRNKDTLAAKIAKVLDNITGNQLPIEQKIGIINPDAARFCIEYAEKVRGVSSTTDTLIFAQVEQVVEARRKMLENKSELEEVRKALDLPDTKKLEEMLSVDVTAHVYNKDKVFTPIDEY